MNYPLISSQAVLAKLHRNFGVDAEQYLNVLLDIGDALMQMSIDPGMIKTGETLAVTDCRVTLPCKREVVLHVEDDNGCKVPKFRPSKTNNDYGATGVEPVRFYWINGNVLHTSWDADNITVHYNKYPIDAEGFPMIPKSGFLLEALTWFCMWKLLLSGYNHPKVDWPTAFQMWEKYYPQAQNDVSFPSPEDQDAFKRMWVSLIPNLTYHETGYTEVVSEEDSANNDIDDFTGVTISN